MSMPDLSRKLMLRKVKSQAVEDLRMSGPEYFMLDRLSDTLDHKKFKEVVKEVSKKLSPKSRMPLVPNGHDLKIPGYMSREMNQPPYHNYKNQQHGSSGSESTSLDMS